MFFVVHFFFNNFSNSFRKTINLFFIFNRIFPFIHFIMNRKEKKIKCGLTKKKREKNKGREQEKYLELEKKKKKKIEDEIKRKE